MNTAPVPLSAREKQVPVDMIGRYRFRRLLLRNERFLLRLFQQLQFAMRQLIYAICHLRHFFIMGDEDISCSVQHQNGHRNDNDLSVSLNYA